MAKGIVVKIWNIKEGSAGRGAGVQISDSIAYITDEEKCDKHLSEGTHLQIGRELTYVMNDVKTLKGVYVGCKSIPDISQATQEMMQIKVFYGKTGGRVALHGIISLDASESDPRNAGKLMMLMSDLLDEIFPDHQAVYAVHTNTENLHVHFIVNTVGMMGKKIHMDKSFMSGLLEPALNRLAQKYGFTPNEEWQRKKGRDVTPFAQRVIELRNAVDDAIERADDYASFLEDLREHGIRAESGKHLSLKAEGMTRAVRSYRLGSHYTQEAIRDRILTKREEMIRSQVTDHTKQTGNGPGVFFTTDPLKKYQDMSKQEKAETLKMLRAGRNPWRERRQSNWQLEKMADEFERTAGVYELIRTFSPDEKNGQAALLAIQNLQKDLAEQKKIVKQGLRDYQPILKLYEEAQKFETRAYLYEFGGCSEYLADYEAYKRICTRLADGYSKSIEEVADFLSDQKAQLLYATAQQKDLSGAYKTIKRFMEGELSQSIGAYTSLFEAVGFSKARSRAQLYGVFESGIRYIAADGADGGYLRVVIMPEEIAGKKTERADITVFDASGHEKAAFSSKDITAKDFNARLNDLKAGMGLYRCHSFDTKEKAVDFVSDQSEKNARRSRAQTGD